MKERLKTLATVITIFTIGAVILASCGVVSPIFVTLRGYEVEADLKATGDDFNWASWYKLNGESGVACLIAVGDMTETEALETIMRPACEAGYVDDVDLQTFFILSRYKILVYCQRLL